MAYQRKGKRMTATQRLMAEVRASEWLNARASAKALFQANLLATPWQPATKQTRLKGLQEA